MTVRGTDPPGIRSRNRCPVDKRGESLGDGCCVCPLSWDLRHPLARLGTDSIKIISRTLFLAVRGTLTDQYVYNCLKKLKKNMATFQLTCAKFCFLPMRRLCLFVCCVGVCATSHRDVFSLAGVSFRGFVFCLCSLKGMQGRRPPRRP